MKRIKLKSCLLRIFVFVMAVVFVFVVTKSNFDFADDIKYIYSTFIGQKSPYNGIIEVWNIDSFESGLKSKASFLEEMGKTFQKRNKGVYVLVRNLTKGEYENLISKGETPDLVSCSYGVADKIKENITAFEGEIKGLPDKFLNAGKKNGELYGLAWCIGFYSLISTKVKIEKAGYDLEKDCLNEIAYLSGYEYKVGKKIKNSKSITFGICDYLMPKNALKAYNKARSIQIEEDMNEELNLKSQYSAYTSFLSNDATILLGTHRDVFRMVNREEKGKVSDAIYLPLLNWTDLVQFLFLCKDDNKVRKMTAEKFANFLVEGDNQEKIEEIGMFSVNSLQTPKIKGVMRDIILENFNDLEIKNIFD